MSNTYLHHDLVIESVRVVSDDQDICCFWKVLAVCEDSYVPDHEWFVALIDKDFGEFPEELLESLGGLTIGEASQKLETYSKKARGQHYNVPPPPPRLPLPPKPMPRLLPPKPLPKLRLPVPPKPLPAGEHVAKAKIVPRFAWVRKEVEGLLKLHPDWLDGRLVFEANRLYDLELKKA